MDEKKKRVLADWLKDAFALEASSMQILKERSRRLEKTDQETYSAMLSHLEKSDGHLGRIRECLERLGESASLSRTAGAFLGGFFKGRAADIADDAIVQDIMEGYAREQLKIISYRAIASAAMEAGEVEILAACEDILSEEREMAAWYDQRLDSAVKEHMEALAD